MNDNEYLERLDHVLKNIEVQATHLEKNSAVLKDVNELKLVVEDFVNNVNDKTEKFETSTTTLSGTISEFDKLERKFHDILKFQNEEIDANLAKANIAVDEFIKAVVQQSNTLNMSSSENFSNLSDEFLKRTDVVLDKFTKSLNDFTTDNKETTEANLRSAEKINSFSGRLEELVTNDSLNLIIKERFSDKIEVLVRSVDKLKSDSVTKSQVDFALSDFLQNYEKKLDSFESCLSDSSLDVKRMFQAFDRISKEYEEVLNKSIESRLAMTKTAKNYFRLTIAGFVVTWGLFAFALFQR
jgi:hypothetical protein